MLDDTQTLGRCPDCGECIPEAWLLVEYQKDDGTRVCGPNVRRVKM